MASSEPVGRHAAAAGGPYRLAGVVGDPVAHSLSPPLHHAAYAAMGLERWSYQRLLVPEGGLADAMADLGPAWLGLSVTMPHKSDALRLAAAASDRARAVGVANTLVRREDGRWWADCTDIDGVLGALGELGVTGERGVAGERGEAGDAADRAVAGRRTAVVVGAGGTAAAAVAALAQLGFDRLVLLVRSAGRARDVAALARDRFGFTDVTITELAGPDGGSEGIRSALQAAAGNGVLISTVPSSALLAEPGLAERLVRVPGVVDVAYHPWPTPLAAAARATGTPLSAGLSMLLHQAVGQVELFTGRSVGPETVRAMRAALVGSAETPAG